jgi:hypothetical protein
MPKRPRQHVIEDLARAQLHSSFASVGWSVEDLDQDYGEDLLVRIFEDGKATPWSFFIQSKAADHIDRFLLQDGRYIAFPIKSKHAQHWERFWEPVVLAVYDTKSEVTYWEVIQSYLNTNRSLSINTPNKSITVHVPTDNKLDYEGFLRLRNRTRTRFERFEAQKEGAQLLIDELHNQWGVRIEYEPEFGLLMLPKGHFQPDASDERTVTVFGRLASQLDRFQKKYKMELQRAFERSIALGLKICIAYEQGAKLQMRNRDGEVLREWQTLEDLQRYIDREQEIEDE